MDILWSPWRMQYLEGIEKLREEESCIFCEKPGRKEDEKDLILARGKRCFAMMNLYPYNPGHAMIAPYRHTGELESLDGEEWEELHLLASRLIKALKECVNPEGFNLGLNLGKAAGAGFDAHLHLHVVPRWVGDTNFMPVLGQTKVLPESLAQTYAKLKSALEGMG